MDVPGEGEEVVDMSVKRGVNVGGGGGGAELEGPLGSVDIVGWRVDDHIV